MYNYSDQGLKDTSFRSTYLHKRHVDLVHIWSLFSVHLHTHKIIVQQLCYVFTLKRLSFHHMTPVTSRITNRQENRLLFRLCLGKSFWSPRIPKYKYHTVVRNLSCCQDANCLLRCSSLLIILHSST